MYVRSSSSWSFCLVWGLINLSFVKWHIHRTRVRSLAMLVTHSLTDWLTDSLPFSKLDWCDPGVWRCLLKTCCGCYCCWCRWWESCWQQFVADLEAEVWSTFVQTLSTRVGQDFEVEVQARFAAVAWPVFFCWCFVEVESWSRFWG